ncbi:MAG: GatB/YqeY domain-containing protein [Gammaproteobacteria bacterium]|nr:GatB/YqeY domain-containing protein [Gammaproteobacteria bacterium]MDE0443300.1 GatB/YqeY domain-containing protein [Gammaproteobacteria bacterium]
MSDLRDRIETATKDAMRARDRERVKALRLVNAELKQAAIDGRKTLADADVVGVLARMVKQRRDSQGQFEAAGREDLAAIERFEIEVIEDFLPRAMSADEIDDAVAAAIEATGAVGMKDMGRVMGTLKGELTGRADMGAVSQVVRAALQG